MRLRVAVLALGLALVAGARPAPARADAFGQVLRSYSTHGRIDPCAFSSATLAAALGEIPSDVEQYTPELRSTIEAALAARGRGACDRHRTSGAPSGGTSPAGGSGSTTSAPAPAASTSPGGSGAGGGGTPSPAAAAPAPAPSLGVLAPGLAAVPAAAAGARSGSGLPVPLLALGVLLVLGLAGLLARALGRRLEPAPGARHALGEAGYRMGARLGDFGDFLRARR